MKADLTRDTFEPINRYMRVLMQQGRVQVDSDFNEQVAILLDYLRALAADLIGPHGGPEDNCGFGLISSAEFAGDFRITSGRYYVDGWLCELNTTPIAVSQPQGFAVNEVRLSALMADGVAFSKPAVGQLQPYVELRSGNNSTVARITDFDAETSRLALSKDVQAILKGQSPELRRVVTYLTQPNYPVSESFELEPNKQYLAYLDVWERHLTFVEDDSMREVALNGADTATRTRLIWQVKLVEGSAVDGAPSPCAGFLTTDPDFWKRREPSHRGKLKAKAKQNAESSDPCITPPHHKYRGVENQLYRVEIHRGGVAWDGAGEEPPAGTATFKWSRENGSVTYPIDNVSSDSSAKATTVTLETLGRDDRFGLVPGDWVELVCDSLVLHETAGRLLQVQEIDRSNMRVTLAGLAESSFVAAPDKHPLLRRWDHKQGDPSEGGLQLAADGAALLLETDDDQWLELEDGVKIQFARNDADDPYVYRTGDFWLIPARVATGDVEWPTVVDATGQVDRVALPPKGQQHHYASLGIISTDNDGLISTQSCRKQFSPLAKGLP